MIFCAGDIETFKFARPIGIGLINSTINLTKQCLFDRPDKILFIGTAGSYGNHKIFDIVESKRASNLELSFLNDDSYTPIENLIVSENKMVKNDTIVNSSNYITTNESLAKKFNNYKIGIENMEFFSVVSVAKKFNIPVAGIFIVTNFTNSDAHKDFKTNHKEAMKKLTLYLIEMNIIKP